ncbi:MAG: hypothetical protein QOJ44_1697 [Acidimicrobiaceae bacterium]|jgi:hypothetical protein|nr:hypothetical protein [Acidimicrobiaceae bacterium]
MLRWSSGFGRFEGDLAQSGHFGSNARCPIIVIIWYIGVHHESRLLDGPSHCGVQRIDAT